MTRERSDKIIDKLDQVPGIDEITAQSIIGHIGNTLNAFRYDKALASWDGLCPGNNQSAGNVKVEKVRYENTPSKP